MENEILGLGTLTLLAIAVPYFFPTIIAGLRGHHNTGGVFIVNLFLGWTLVGWIIAFVMTCTAARRRVYVVSPPQPGQRVTSTGVPAMGVLQSRILGVGLLVLIIWFFGQFQAHSAELRRAPPPPVAVDPSEPPAMPPAEVEHNGSLMLATVLPDGDLEIRYARPRPGLPVVPGQLLVLGRWIDGPDGKLTMAAISHSFPPGCAPVPYKVMGTTPDKWTLVLTGPAPVVDPAICQIVGWTWSKNSVLVFKFIRGM